MQTRRSNWAALAVALVVVVAMALMSSPATANESALRVVVIEVEDGSERQVRRELSAISGVKIETYEWFVEQVESRAFRPDRVLADPSDLEWVMDGSDIDLIITLQEHSEEDYQVQFITAEEAMAEHEFLADRGHDGVIRRGGAMVIRFELERFLDKRPDVIPDRRASDTDAAEGEDEDGEVTDPSEMRRQAAAEREALKERLSRDWLWIRGHGRWMQREFAVATYGHEGVDDAVYTFETGGYPGLELDAEMFPFGRDDPDMQEAGFYLSYTHGFHSINITESDGRQIGVSVMDIGVEGGALYRLDTPLDEDNRQIRLKLGGRYDGFMVSDDLVVPSSSMLSLVLGTRLVLPLGVEEFAITSSVDLLPIAFFGTNEEVFGSDSFSWGFGTELGAVYQVMDSGFVSLGYGFRLMRSYFDDEGEPIEASQESDLPVFDRSFTNSDVFNFSHGLRAGFIFQY